MSQSDKQYLDSLKKRYAKDTRKERSKMLDEFVETTGYHRKYAIAIAPSARSVVRAEPSTPGKMRGPWSS